MREENEPELADAERARAAVARPGVESLLPFLCFAGVCIASYLSLIHYSLLLGDLSLGSTCGAESDCNSVVASDYGKLAGVPVSIWGICYYLCAGALSLGILLMRRSDSYSLARALSWITGAALAFDAYLGWAMWARINLACPLCLATYGVNAAIFAVALRIRRRLGRENGHWRSLLPRVDVLLRPGDHDYYRETLKLVLGGFAMAGVLLVLAIDAVASKAVLEGQQERLAGLIREIHEGRPVEIPDEDRPARGTPDARTTLVVFSDFMCGQCRLASRYLEIVAANHRGSLRIVYRHFPGDNQCNAHASRSPRPGACTIARAAECAGRRGRFWEFHDAVFRDPGRVMPAKLERYAARAGLWDEAFRSCLGDTAVDASVRSDIALAHSLGVIGTPTTFVNGRGVGGALKPWMLEAAIREIESLSGPASR